MNTPKTTLNGRHYFGPITVQVIDYRDGNHFDIIDELSHDYDSIDRLIQAIDDFSDRHGVRQVRPERAARELQIDWLPAELDSLEFDHWKDKFQFADQFSIPRGQISLPIICDLDRI